MVYFLTAALILLALPLIPLLINLFIKYLAALFQIVPIFLEAFGLIVGSFLSLFVIACLAAMPFGMAVVFGKEIYNCIYQFAGEFYSIRVFWQMTIISIVLYTVYKYYLFTYRKYRRKFSYAR